MIYISTGSDNSSTGYEVAKNLIRNDFKHIELSSGQFDANALENLTSFISKCNFQVHHYFPPPKNSFVLNLASRDNHVCEKSYQFCKRAVDLCKQLNCKYYSVHAGYLLDPEVNDLGQRIGFSTLSDRDFSKSIFIDQIRKLSSYASQREIKILIENNVITQKNLKVFGVNPLLMADHLESLEIVEEIGDNVGLLVDLAHLKVSSLTMGFCKYEFLEATNEHTYAYHLSDNDGITDSNLPVRADSWFWNYLRKDLDYYSLEVYRVTNKILQEQVALTMKSIWK